MDGVSGVGDTFMGTVLPIGLVLLLVKTMTEMGGSLFGGRCGGCYGGYGGPYGGSYDRGYGGGYDCG